MSAIVFANIKTSPVYLDINSDWFKLAYMA